MCNKGITQFYLPPTHEPYLPLLPSCKASLPFGCYQLVLLDEQRHIAVKNLPRVLRRVPGRDSNPRPLDRKFDTLPTAPRSGGQRSRSRRDVIRANICQVVNNSAWGCSISIKFSTDCEHVPSDLPQTFKVNGSKVKVIA